MMKIRNIGIAILTVFGLSVNGQSLYRSLENGFGIGSEVDEYPEVTWLQGVPVTHFEKDKTYIIECWATWCGPCIAAIPHMNELHKEYDDKIVIVGQSAMENDLRKVETFLKSKGDGMSYRVAYAGGASSNFSKKWLIPGKIEALPHTIVIQDNKVIWMPHPNELTRAAVEMLINRTFSLDKVKESQRKAPMSTARELFYAKDYQAALLLLDSIIMKEPDNTEAIATKSMVLKDQGDYDGAVRLLMTQHQKRLSGDIAYRLYQTLLEGKDALRLQLMVEEDIERAINIDNSPILDIVAEGYQVYCSKEDSELLADYVERITAKSSTSNPLLALLAISPYYPIEDNKGVVTKALLNTAKKFFSMSQMELYYLYKVVHMFWEKGERDGALQILNMSIAAGRRDGLPENRLEAMNELATKILKGEFPSEEQFRILMDHARQ